jgi:hypothetical protein
VCGVFNILMFFILVLADGLCCASILHPIWCWYKFPEAGTISIDLDQLSRFYLKKETESSLRNVMF